MSDASTEMEPTRRRVSRIAAIALATVALCGAASCTGKAGGEGGAVESGEAPAPQATPVPSPAIGGPAPFGAAPATTRPAGASAEHAAPAGTLRLSPDLLADLEGRVGPQTAARLRDAAGAGRAFARRLGVEGQAAQGVADVFTQLAFDVAQGERDGAAGSAERASAVQRAAQNAIDGLRWLIPGSALPEGEREIARFTGGVAVTFSHPSAAEWERTLARFRQAPEIGPLP